LERKAHASFTVEAMLVLFVVIFAVFSVMYMSFFLFDYCRIRSVTDLVLHKAVFNYKHEADMETGIVYYDEIEDQEVFYQIFGMSDSKINSIKTMLDKKLSKGLLATKVTDIQVTANMFKINIKVQGEFKIPIKGVAVMLFRKKHMELEVSERYHNPAKTVRISEIALELGSKIKGLDELKEKLQNLLHLP